MHYHGRGRTPGVLAMVVSWGVEMNELLAFQLRSMNDIPLLWKLPVKIENNSRVSYPCMFFSLTGNPIADVFAVCARENNAILAIADGVNWGEKARIAGQCAVRGAVDFLEAVLFQDGRVFRTTKVLYEEKHIKF